MRPSRSRTAITLVLAVIVAAGCGRADKHAADSTAVRVDSAGPGDTAVAAAPAPTPQGSAATAPATAPVTVAEIDEWQRGMQAELDAVKQAGAQLASAKTSTDSLNAMAAASETDTRPAGAHAAGMDEERYKFVSTTLSDAVNNLAPMDQVMKVSDMPKEMVDQMQKGREAQIARMSDVLPPEVVQALRPRAAELHKQSITLSAARLQAMGQKVGGD